MIESKGLTYAGAGVDIDKGNDLVEKIKPIVRSTGRKGADAEIGGFGGLFDLKAAGFRDPILVAANDGVGTKVKIAIESGLHDTIGIDLVAMCVNDLIVQGAEPLFFLDYYATSKLDADVAARVIGAIARGCREAGAALIGGETAEMPGIYVGADYDLAGFAVGAVEREKLLPRQDIQSGDLILGLLSSGVHSNGFSLVRKVVAQTGLPWTDPAPFAPEMSLAEALLTPTRIYVKTLLRLLKESDGVKGLAHVTGGGFPDNLPRVLPKALAIRLDLSAVPVLDVFRWLAKSGAIAEGEMLRTFNCGIGMGLIIKAERLGEISQALEDAGETPIAIGEVVPAQNDKRFFTHGKLAL